VIIVIWTCQLGTWQLVDLLTLRQSCKLLYACANNVAVFFAIRGIMLSHQGLPPWRGGGAYAPMTRSIF